MKNYYSAGLIAAYSGYFQLCNIIKQNLKSRMSKTVRSFIQGKVKLSALAVVLGLLVGGQLMAQTNQIIRYVRVGGNDLRTGITPSTDPTNSAGAFATIQRAIDQFRTDIPLLDPNTGQAITPLPPGTTYIIDVGPGIYNDPSTIFIPNNYAQAGLQQHLIIRGPRVGESPNVQAFPGGPTIREYNPTREAIIRTPYGAAANGSNLRGGHRPLAVAPPNNSFIPPVGVNRPIFSIGCNNRVTFEGLMFESRTEGNVLGGRIFEVVNRNCNPNNVSTTQLTFRQNIFLGENNLVAGGDNRGINLFESIVELRMVDNRFYNITWAPFNLNSSNANNRGGIAVYVERVYRVIMEGNHFIGNLNNDINGFPIRTMDNAIYVEHTNFGGGAPLPPPLYSTNIRIEGNQISNIRGSGIYVNTSGVTQDTLVIRENNMYNLEQRVSAYRLLDPLMVNGIHVIGSKSVEVLGNRFGADYFSNTSVNGVNGHGINVEDLRPHTLLPGFMHRIGGNIVARGTGGDGIVVQRSVNVRVELNTVSDAFNSGIHITDAGGRMENIMVHSNTIERANRRSNLVGSSLVDYLQSGGIAIFSDHNNTGKFNTSSKVYVTNNIIRGCGNAGLVLRNNSSNVSDVNSSQSNFYKKDIRVNYNLFIGNDDPSDGGYNPGVVRQRDGIKALAQRLVFVDGDNRYGQIDATGNWWDYQSLSAAKYGPVDVDNPLNNSTFPLGGVNNLGAGRGQRINEVLESSQGDVVVYSPWLGGRTADIEGIDTGVALSIPDDDPATPGYQNKEAVSYYLVYMNGRYPVPGFQSIGVGFDPSYPLSINSPVLGNRPQRLTPTVDVGGVNGMINKAISLAKDGDKIEVWRGLYVENVVIPNKFGTVSGSEGRIVIRSVENGEEVAPKADARSTVANNLYRTYSAVISPGRLDIANVRFVRGEGSNPSQEATIRQITSVTMGAALNILDNNRVDFSGFRIETNTNQAVNSSGSNVGVRFRNNLVEVFPLQRNGNGLGMASFVGHSHGIEFVGNTFRRISGTSDGAAVALHVNNVDAGVVNISDNSFEGNGTMSSAILIDGCSSVEGVKIERNLVKNTYQSGVILRESGSSGVNGNIQIRFNDIWGNNLQNTVGHAGVLVTSSSVEVGSVLLENNHVLSNRRGGVLVSGGNGSAVRVRYNTFHNNDALGNGSALINNSASGVLDATGNWWGSAAGPVIGLDVNNVSVNRNVNNGGSPNVGVPQAVDFTDPSVRPSSTFQQRIVGGNVAFNPWLGGFSEDQDASLGNRRGAQLPDRDNTRPGVQFNSSANLAVLEANAWYVGVWNAGPLPLGGVSFTQRANDLADEAGGDIVYFHDDDYVTSVLNPGVLENVNVNRNLKFQSLVGDSRLHNITVSGGKRLELLTDFRANNVTLSGVGNGNIYTYPYRTILPTPSGQQPLYQLYDVRELRTLRYSGVLTEGAGNFVHGRVETSRIPSGVGNETFGNIGYTLIPGVGANVLGVWTVSRTADTKNQQPLVSSPANPNRASQPNLPPQSLDREVSPFFAFNSSSIDQGWVVSYQGADPVNWSVRLSWLRDNDALNPEDDFRPYLPERMFVANAAGVGSSLVVPLWRPLQPSDVVVNTDIRSVPSSAGVIIRIGRENFVNATSPGVTRGIFTVFGDDNSLRAYAGPNRERCENGDGVVLGGINPDDETDTRVVARTASGGVPPYTYRWTCSVEPNCGLNSRTVANPIASPSVDSVVYTVTVTDAVGNQRSDQVTVFTNRLPRINFNLPAELCQNGEVVSLIGEASGGSPFVGPRRPLGEGYLYYWRINPGVGALRNDQMRVASLDPRELPSGRYSVTLEVEDSKGCVVRLTRETFSNPAPVAEAGPSVVNVCQDGSVVLGGNPSGRGGTGALSYSWRVVGARNVTRGVNIAVPSIGSILSSGVVPNPTFRPDRIGGQDVLQYMLELVVTDSKGCQARDMITVQVNPLPMADAGASREYCYNGLPQVLGGEGGTGLMGTAPYSFEWSSNSPLSLLSYLSDSRAESPLFNAPDVAQVSDFSYVVRVTDAAGCVAVGSVNLRVHPRLVANAGGEVVTCVNSVFTLGGNPSASGGNGNFSYFWTPRQGLIDGEVDPQRVSNPRGRLPFVGTYTYTLRVSNDIGCEAISSVRVIVGNQLRVDGGVYRPVCAGSELQLQASVPGVSLGTPGYRYTWTPGERLSARDIANPVFRTLEPGTYTYRVDVVDPNGCQGQAMVSVVVNPVPVVNAGEDVVKCAESVVRISGIASGGVAFFPQGYSYQWSPDEGLEDSRSASTRLSLRFAGNYRYRLTVTDGNGCSASDEILVRVNAKPVVEVNGMREVCPGRDLELGVRVSGGAPGYSYSWSPAQMLSNSGISNPVFNSGMSGVYSYTVTVTDANGCSNSGVVGLMVLPSMVVNVEGVRSTCPGDEVVLRGSVVGGTPGFGGGYEYRWSGEGIGSRNTLSTVFSRGVAGVYPVTLTVTDARGCERSATVEIRVNERPVVSAGSDLRLCSGDVVQLEGFAVGGDRNYRYSWTPGLNLSSSDVANPLFSTQVAGSYRYTLTVTDGNGCSGSSSVNIVVNNRPVVEVASQRFACVGSGISLSARASGGLPGPTGYSYSWTPIVNLSNASVSNPVFLSELPGVYNYTVTATDANGCSAEGVVRVEVSTLPVVTAGGNRTACTGSGIVLEGNAVGGVGPYSFSWSPAANLSNASAQAPVFNANIAGTYNYTLTVTDSRGCVGRSSASILVNPSPVASAGSNKVLCAGGSVTLEGSAVGGVPGAGYVYRWTPSTGLNNASLAVPTLSLNVPGNYVYTLEVTDANNCRATSSVNVRVAEALVANAGGVVNACTGSSITLNGTASGGDAPYSYRWTPETNLSNRNIRNPQFLSNVTGDFVYTLEVTDANGCVSSSRVVVQVRTSPVANAGNDAQVCVGSPLQLMGMASGGTGSYRYTWSPSENLSDANVANPVFRSNVAGTYNLALTVTDANGCSSVDFVQVVVNFSLNVSAGRDRGTCRGQNVVLEGSIGGDQSGATFSWSPVSGLLNANSLRPTFIAQNVGTYTYTLTATDVNGCSGSARVTITVLNPPVASAGARNVYVCTQGSVRLNGSASNGSGDYSYSWSPAARLSSSNVANPVFSTTAPGIYNYTLRVTDNVSGCTSEDVVQVEVATLPAIELVATKVDVSCDGESDGMITATARVDANFPDQQFVYSLDGVNYQSSNFFMNLRAGSYTVYARNVKWNCEVSTVVAVNNPGVTQITSISQISESSAVVSWTPYNGRGNVRYILQYRVVGSQSWTEVENIPGSTSSYVLTNLQNFTNYEVRVRSRCNGVLSPSWSEVATFRTLQTQVGTCRRVGGVYVNQVNNSNSVDVHWNSDATAVCYDLQYGLSSANPATWAVVSGISTNSYRIGGLTPGFSYGVRVRAHCLSCPASEANRSQYSEIVNFVVDNLRVDSGVEEGVSRYVVYPNPTTGRLQVELRGGVFGELGIRVVDVSGRVVVDRRVEVVEGMNSVELDLTGYASGIYLLQLQQGADVETVKVVLK
ncbi:MAG: fibronectin type III domain-containing protein [Bacteroidia bacterium]|nr:fibronectin type III domain-containing protein [Bacteroidia bacterium]